MKRERGFYSPFRLFGANQRNLLERWELYYAKLGIETKRNYMPRRGRAIELLVRDPHSTDEDADRN